MIISTKTEIFIHLTPSGLSLYVGEDEQPSGEISFDTLVEDYVDWALETPDTQRLVANLRSAADAIEAALVD
jgi:hypothetical protein